MWQRTLKKSALNLGPKQHTLNSFQSALNLGLSQHTLKQYFKGVTKVHLHFVELRHLKNMYESQIMELNFYAIVFLC